MIDFLIQTDKDLFLFLNALNTTWLDPVMWLFSGKYFWIPLYLAVLTWSVIKHRWNALWFLLFAIITLAACDQISVVIKFATERPRPSHNPDFAGVVHHVNNYKGGAYGFVSSHAANTFGFAIFSLVAIKKRWFTISILTWAIVVSYSRIYLGVHYPADITCGAILGMSLGYLIFKVFQITIKKFPIKQVKK